MRTYETKIGKSLAILTAVGACLAATGAAQGVSTFTMLATFNNANGADPESDLTLSGSMLYGTTLKGGADNMGTVFAVPLGGGSPTTLATFNGTNGASPQAGLTLSGSTLYGTASGGGTYGSGTVFSVPISGGSPTTLATFIDSDRYGDNPYGKLALSGSTLYGPASGGFIGAAQGFGTVYSVPLGGGTPTTLATFNYSNGSGASALAVSGSTLYGTTSQGGAYGDGTVFSIPLSGGSPTTLATFNTTNGSMPYAGLIVSGSTLYGTTQSGGVGGYGTVFSLPVSGGFPTTLATFNRSNGTDPLGVLTLSGTTLYGTTSQDGTTSQGGANYGNGTVFSVPLSGGSPTTLVTFNGTNGFAPEAGLTLSGSTLYGTTYGGTGNYGTVFAITMGNSVTVGAGLTSHFPAIGGTSPTATTTAGLTIQAGGTAVVDPATPHAGRQLLVVNSPGLSIAGSNNISTGLLDLSNNDLDLPGASLTAMTNQLTQGFAGGNWNGSGGIISSIAAANSSHLTSLGIIQNNQSGTALYNSANQFDGTTPGTSDILVKYTYHGDANLDGKVDGSDYSLIDNGFLHPTTLSGWYNGDFNYDGKVNGSDYTLIDNAFNTQGGNLSITALIAEVTAQLAPTSPVPEPASVWLLALGGLVLARRRG